MAHTQPIQVTSEVGTLKRIIIHSPDGGIGKVIPTKAQDWLFEDILHLDTLRRQEYDLYIKLLLYFLDYDKIHGNMKAVDSPEAKRDFYKPSSQKYFNSDKVLDPQFLLSEILEDDVLRNRIVASVCSHEKISYQLEESLFEVEDRRALANTLISGMLPNGKMIFPPIPNYIFTRDIAIVINNHILLNRPAKEARTREGILTRYLMFNHPAFAAYRDKIIELTDHEDYFLLDEDDKIAKKVTLEGGDVMTVAPNHVLVGISERTSVHAASRVIELLFAHKVVEKVTVVKIPVTRAYMHIDTTFTQVKRNMWVMLGSFSRKGHKMGDIRLMPGLGKEDDNATEILQYQKGQQQPKRFDFLEDLLDDISRNDLGATEPTEIVYSGDGEFPYGQREQWTDSCNVLALKEGVVIGYDRNDRTSEGFRKKGMKLVKAQDLLEQFDAGTLHPNDVENTLILLPSAELSRARGGSHCISMPLLREPLS